MTIRVEAESRFYDVIIEKGCLKKASEYMDLNRKCLIVTDEGIPSDYADAVKKQCKDAFIVCVACGEESKSMANLERILETMLNAGFTRSDCVVAVGGGMSGDLAGFAAAVYMRGIDFYNIPTTLLSQADSSIGGKTAVNLGGAKNPVGAFHQPKAVLIDTELLKSLGADQISSGMAEVIKSAMIADAELFEYIEKCEEPDCEKLLTRSLMIKKHVVEEDERESSLRKVLNFGHTIGHGIEATCGMLHGHAVALGMMTMCEGRTRERLAAVLEKYALPTSVACDSDAVFNAVMKDKKMKDGNISAVVVDEPGSFRITEMGPDEIRKRIEQL